MATNNSLFAEAPLPRVPSNWFDLSHDVKMTFNIGELAPCLLLDVLPGDEFKISPQSLLRFATLLAPIMHRVRVNLHIFYVPYRITWPEFPEYIQTNGQDIVAPFVTIHNSGGNFSTGTIADYLGLPTDELNAASIAISPLPFAAYRLIYDFYYRDENLQDEIFVPLVPGNNSSTYGIDFYENGDPLTRSLRHDFFTSMLPFAQKGDPVQLPLTFQDNIPVQFDSNLGQWKVVDPSGLPVSNAVLGSSAVGNNLVDASGSPAAVNLDPDGTLFIDIQSDAVNLETLRTAIVTQEFLERDARGGTRYDEKIRAHYGVRTSDARVQKPEYIGGTSQMMTISEVLSTAQSDNTPAAATTFVGTMAGHGISVGGGNRFYYRAEEFGCILGIISVLPDPAWQQGIDRMWTKFSVLDDFAWPAFSNLGEQEVLNQEIYAAHTAPAGTFGYQSRYAQYKFKNNRVSGQFRDSELNFWHMGIIFDGEPALNDEFIQAYSSKFNRVFAVQDSNVDQILANIYFDINVKRRLPRWGIPSFGSTNMGGM